MTDRSITERIWRLRGGQRPTQTDRHEVALANLAEQRARASWHFEPVPTPGPGDEPTRYSLIMLGGITAKGARVFAGIDPLHPTKSTTKRLERRRAANRVARRSRRVNRLAGAR